MKKRIISILLAVALVLSLSACSLTKKGKVEYEQILSSENISIDEAVSMLENCEYKKALPFKDEIDKLSTCDGRFVTRDNSSNTLYADLSLYLINGEIMCSADFTGFAGEILDGKVEKTEKAGFDYEVITKGVTSKDEKDIKIYLSSKKVEISCGISDYTLTKFTDNPEEYENIFYYTKAYKDIAEIFDDNFENQEHNYYYDESTKTFIVYFETFEDIKEYLESGRSDVKETWGNLVQSTINLSESILVSITTSDYSHYVDHFEIRYVEKVNKNNEYNDSDMLIIAQDGKLIFDILTGEEWHSEKEGSQVMDKVADWL